MKNLAYEVEGEGALVLVQGQRPQLSWQYGSIHESLHLPQSFCWLHVQPPGGLTSSQLVWLQAVEGAPSAAELSMEGELLLVAAARVGGSATLEAVEECEGPSQGVL